MTAERVLDLRGLRCPWPALRLARALRQGLVAPVRVLADDPAAPGEMRAVATANGLLLDAAADGSMILSVAGVRQAPRPA